MPLNRDRMFLSPMKALAWRTEIERATGRAWRYADIGLFSNILVEYRLLHSKGGEFSSARGQSRRPACVHIRYTNLQSSEISKAVEDSRNLGGA